MSLLSDLKSGASRLRKAHIERDSSAPRLVVELDGISDLYDAEVQHCNIERWLPPLEKHALTFETVLVPMTTVHANAILAVFDATEHAQLDLGAPALHEREDFLIKELEGPLQAALDRLGGGCIVKTSSRSPKDAAARTGALPCILRESLAASPQALQDENEMLRVVCEAEGAALRFSSARAVIRAFVLSERIWQDMTLALRHPESFEQNIVVRRWEDIRIDMEFRCFVHAGKLTAISQYAYQLYSSTLVSSLDQAKQAIADYFESRLRAVLVQGGFETCVVDIALVPPSWGAWVIEINPFLPTTDAGLFSWENERAVLEGKAEGVEYPVVRICERRRHGALAMVPKAWKDVVETVTSAVRRDTA
ncbi:hypothetical protein AURDEDRAFT_179421 [Auricularia subglabra TFB-10046 SS5]|nr:hypothetical protein AURDEDRAFT_179421 [Auricularia subglabra TFB-10046 SS5]